MTDATADNTPEDDNVLAAEYVLGVLDAAPRRAAAERIERDPRFCRQCKSLGATSGVFKCLLRSSDTSPRPKSEAHDAAIS